jgi:hypothetical protein
MDDDVAQSVLPQPPVRLAAPRCRHDWRSWAKLFLVLGFVYSLLLVYDWLAYRGTEKVPGVITRPLGPCDVDWFYQRGGLIVLSCPHVDGIKFWPLPIEYPWFEDLPVPAWEQVARLLFPLRTAEAPGIFAPRLLSMAWTNHIPGQDFP